MKNRAQRAQEQNRAQASPAGTAYLIGNPDFWDTLSSAFSLPPAPPRAPKHPRWMYITRIYPNIKYPTRNSPPTCATASTTTRLPHLALFISIYRCPQPPPNSPALLHTPAPSSGILTILPAHPKDEISNPTSPRHPGEHPVLLVFLGGWQLPLYMYQVVW